MQPKADKNPQPALWVHFCLWIALVAVPSLGGAAAPSASVREKLLANAAQLLDEANISYAYGGNKFGYGQLCELCNACIRQFKPSSRQQLAKCPICRHCSLDCTHFIHTLFQRTGIEFPYLTSSLMADLSSDKLLKLYGFYDAGFDVDAARGGDILVYEGHAVILEKNRHQGRGDIIHVTSGRDIRLAGQAIQRERFADLGYFRGPLRRILRHMSLDPGPPGSFDPEPAAPNPVASRVDAPSSPTPGPAPVRQRAPFRPVR